MSQVSAQPTKRFPLLIVEDDADMARLLARYAQKAGFDAKTALTFEAGSRLIKTRPFDVILSDLRLPDGDGLALLKAAKAHQPEASFVLVTGYADVQTAVEGFRAGLSDLITKPFNTAQLKALLQRLHELKMGQFRVLQLSERLSRQQQMQAELFFEGDSDASNTLKALVERVAPTDLPVLLEGETGVGKSALAKLIHQLSARHDGPFFELNCAAVPENLIESELFGHEKGAFTGADTRRIGLLELADGGTLFLDELNSMSPAMQSKLLLFLQEQSFMRVGGHEKIRVSVRLLFASNKPLSMLVAGGSLREDLYYRINVFPIEIPPLRGRKADIPRLAAFFLARAAKVLNRPVHRLSADAESCLMAYDWPGNVRELENIMQRAVVLCDGEHIEAGHLPLELRGEQVFPARPDLFPQGTTLAEVERLWITHVLEQLGGNKTAAARALGIDPSTLHRKLARMEGKG